MLLKRANLKFWLNVAATALLVVVPAWRAGRRRLAWKGLVGTERPFGEPQSSEEPYDVELRRARERGRGRQAIRPLQIPWRGWYDIVWRTYREMQSDRLLSIAGGVSFFVLLAIFPAITALVSAYGLFFSPSTIINNLSILNEFVPDNVLGIVREQANRIASNYSSALSLGIILGILVSLWSAMSGVKAMIDALNVIYEQKERRSFIKLNLVALAFTLAGFAALHKFLLIGASALALASSALAALPAVADDNDFFYLTQPNGKKIVFAPISIVAIWRPPQGVCKGETQIVTGPMSFCVSDQPEDVIKKLQDFPCVENPRTSAQTLRRCK